MTQRSWSMYVWTEFTSQWSSYKHNSPQARPAQMLNAAPVYLVTKFHGIPADFTKTGELALVKFDALGFQALYLPGLCFAASG